MVLRDCNSNILNDFKRFFDSMTYVFCMVSFEKKKCVLVRSENRESGPTASVKNVFIIDVP